LLVSLVFLPFNPVKQARRKMSVRYCLDFRLITEMKVGPRPSNLPEEIGFLSVLSIRGGRNLGGNQGQTCDQQTGQFLERQPRVVNHSRFGHARLYIDEAEKTTLSGETLALSAWRAYFCQVRFLCRFARNALRRLCLLIFVFLRFFSEPIICQAFL
jgi:hypothetical protein